jgi:hypothetical protein
VNCRLEWRVAMKDFVTTLVPSAKAESVCSGSGYPALPCRAFIWRRYAAGARRIPALRFGLECRNKLIKGRACLLAVLLLPMAAMGVEHP